MSRDTRSSGPILGRGTKAIGSLIGAGTEAYAHHKQKKAQQTEQDNQPPSYQAGARADRADNVDDEDEWDLDDASIDLNNEERKAGGKAEHRPLAPTIPASEMTPLPLPVILPQCRPQTKARGFVHAYAPLLDIHKGIDEELFLQFLDDFNKSSQASSVIQAVNMASMIVGAVPSVATMALSTAMNLGAKAAAEGQYRYKTNSFLDETNKTLFNPCNLHAVIMTFKPESSSSVLEINPDTANAAIAKNMSSAQESKMGKMRGTTSGTTHGEVALPESAPLIYPALDKAIDTSPDGKPPSKYQRSSAFITNYLDRRAQAEYAGTQGADSALSQPQGEKQFSSRYADPNHAANSGGIFALVTGGAFDPRKKSLLRRAERKSRFSGTELTDKDRENIAMGRGGPQKQSRRPQVIKGVRRAMKPDVLYLLVAEVPRGGAQMDERQGGYQTQDDGGWHVPQGDAGRQRRY